MKYLTVIFTGLLAIALTACSGINFGNQQPTQPMEQGGSAGQMQPAAGQGGEMGMGPGMGRGMGRRMGGGSNNQMRNRHHAQIPGDYAGLSSPVAADDESLARGAEIYTAQCATCHGDGGMGDGPAGAALEPPAAPVAHTSQMMGDDYLFWRISEGGASFQTAMPSFKAALDEQERWDVINYMRALGKGQIQPARGVGGAMYNPAEQAAHQDEMLQQAIDQKLITSAEADTFKQVHNILEEKLTETVSGGGPANMDDRQSAALSELIADGLITQQQADEFLRIHDLLDSSGLMQ